MRGDAPKVNCTTCHQGVDNPFHGVGMLDDYPVWRTHGPSAAIEPVDLMVPEEVQPSGNGQGEDGGEGDQAAVGTTVPEKTSMAPGAKPVESVVR